MVFRNYSRLIGLGQTAAQIGIAVSAAALVIGTALSMAGILPWVDLYVAVGDTTIEWGGKAAQIGLTALFLMLATYVPTGRQVLMLEAAHREFAVGMDDITRAYAAAHSADRAGVFSMQREFDAVRERFQYLKGHPDLPEIDAELLTIAAQMSQQSRELAQIFSDEKIARATESLEQRRKDASELEGRIQNAHAAIREMRRTIEEVDIEESSVAAQLNRLREDMTELEGRIAVKPRKGRHLRPVSDVG